MVIYKATNLVNQKIYIGQTNNLEKRKKRHAYLATTSSTAFHKALRKYGYENFRWDVLAECETRTQANSLESKFINEYGGISNPFVYNEKDGGHCFTTKHWTKEDKQIYSERAKKSNLNKKGSTPENIVKSVETRKRTGVYDRLSERQKGDHNSAKREEVRKKISESMKLRWQDPNYSRNKQKNS